MSSERCARFVRVRGVVQGVGFRPFVYGLATRLGLTGWVRNTSSGVEIALEGPESTLAEFAARLPAEAPPRARIEQVTIEDAVPTDATGFRIDESHPESGQYQLISPDIGLCDDCRRELFDPRDRRYRYPFTNCTNCGPRFTIIRDIPYDRPATTMAAFKMCPACQAEYDNPLDRRFHAQPNACPVCGPQVALTDAAGRVLAERGEAIRAARAALRAGQIVAVKGLGGFQLACDATSEAAVERLRARKHRPDKPFAVMVWDLDAARALAHVSEEEAGLLESAERPIVLVGLTSETGGGPLPLAPSPTRGGGTVELRASRLWFPLPDAGRGPGGEVPPAPASNPGGEVLCPSVTRGLSTLGVMLPYTPLHYLLLEPEPGFPAALVMTSGNLSEEPIAMANDEARQRLAGIADLFLLHDRDIHARYDDSVYWVVRGGAQPVRRARGYAPFPVRLPAAGPQVLACGPEMKNTFCFTRDAYAFLGPHIGDLENAETLAHYEASVEHYQHIFRLSPVRVAYDLHPEYLATKYALARWGNDPRVQLVGVQHHHAHIAACLVDNGQTGPALGVALDGTGYGADGTIWGGEFLRADLRSFERLGHLAPFRLPGGAAAIHRPLRTGLALVLAAGMDPAAFPALAHLPAQEIAVVRTQVERGLNAPLTTSAGRLFDAVAALAGLRGEVSYEAQAAMELEAQAALVGAQATSGYPFALFQEDGTWLLDWRPMLPALATDLRQGLPLPVIAARFHAGFSGATVELVRRLVQATGLRTVALSGGCFQNRLLLEATVRGLEALGCTVLTHRQVPTNDGGVALGQAAVGMTIEI